MLEKKIASPRSLAGEGEVGENNGFGSHTCGGLFAFGNKERNDKRKARARSHRPGRGVGTRRQGGGARGVAKGGGGSLREQWRNNVQIAVSDARNATQVSLCGHHG